MNKCFKTMLAAVVFGFAHNSMAEPYNLPIQLDYTLIKKAVVSQLFKGEGGAAEVWKDKHNCSFLNLFNPRISGVDGQIKLINDVQVQFGTAFGGQCIPILAQQGTLETLQKLKINKDHTVLSLPLTQAIFYDRQGQPLKIDKLQDLITKAVGPKLATVKLDLNESRGDMEKTVAEYLPSEKAGDFKQVLDTLKFSGAEANGDGVKVTMAFDAPVKQQAQKPEAPFTEAEQKQWQALWEEWDGFLSKAIKQAASEAKSPELSTTLTGILAESRTAFQAGLKSQSPQSADPVRVFFTQTWQKLAPHMRTLAKELPEVEALRYLTFIAATDVIYELDNVGAPFGLALSSDGLRKLGRLVLAEKHKAAAK